MPTPGELECETVWSPVCHPSLDSGCPYGHNDDWSCADRVAPSCFDDWRRRMAVLWSAYYKGDTHVNMLFADMLGGRCEGRGTC